MDHDLHVATNMTNMLGNQEIAQTLTGLSWLVISILFTLPTLPTSSPAVPTLRADANPLRIRMIQLPSRVDHYSRIKVSLDLSHSASELLDQQWEINIAAHD